MKLKNVRVALSEPRKFIPLGNGYWCYNYLVKTEQSAPRPDTSAQSDDPGHETKAVTIYHSVRIIFFGRPDYKRCVEAVIREYLTQSQEFDLINSYNRAQLGQLSEEDTSKARTDYTEYLELLDEIKTKVHADFDTRNADLGSRRAASPVNS